MARKSLILLALLGLAIPACDTSEAHPVDRDTATAATDDGPRVRRVWSDAEDYATPSPDGRLVTFVDWSTGDVAVHDLTTAENRRITDKGTWTENGSWAEYPEFGPEGDRVVYSYGNDVTGDPFRYELRYVELGDTTQHLLRALDSGNNWIAPLDWSDRGILFTEWDGPGMGALSILDPATGNVMAVEPMGQTHPRSFGEARLSPDDRYVAYTKDRTLLIRDLSSGTLETVSPRVSSFLDWTPDGDGLVVHASHDGETGFWQIPVSGGAEAGDPQLIRAGIPTVMPGGARAGDAYYYKIPVDAPRLYVGSIDVSETQILESPTPITTPVDGGALISAWSPDGRQLAYLLRPLGSRGDHRLMIRDMEGQELRELAHVDMGRINSMGWSADGSEVYLIQRTTRNLVGVSVEDGSMRTVIPDLGHRLAVSSDGRTVAAIRQPGPDPEFSIVVGDIRSGQARTLLTLSGEASVGALAFRGPETLVYAMRHPGEGDSEIRQVSLGDGSVETLARLEYPGHFEGPDLPMAITSDGRHALVPGAMEWEEHHEVYSVDLTDGSVEATGITVPPGARAYFALHPDGSRFVYVDGDLRSELWILDQIDR